MEPKLLLRVPELTINTVHVLFLSIWFLKVLTVLDSILKVSFVPLEKTLPDKHREKYSDMFL